MTLLRRLFALLLLALPLPAAASPALWKVADADTTIYLFGTVHLLPKGEPVLTGPVKAAFDKSDTLALEVILPADPRAAAQVMLKRGIAVGLPPIDQRIDPARRSALTASIKRLGLPDAMLPNMETWLLALTLTQAQIVSLGLDADSGVEAVLRAAAKGKALVGLETLDQQLALFDTLPESDQRALLASTVDELSTMQTELNEMLASWRSGDTERLGRLINDDLQASPGLTKTLLVDRNARFADWVKARLTTPGTVMLAVGAGHLAGPDSVQAMLARRGLKAERVK